MYQVMLMALWSGVGLLAKSMLAVTIAGGVKTGSKSTVLLVPCSVSGADLEPLQNIYGYPLPIFTYCQNRSVNQPRFSWNPPRPHVKS
jgi:hypothetical protein